MKLIFFWNFLGTINLENNIIRNNWIAFVIDQVKTREKESERFLEFVRPTFRLLKSYISSQKILSIFATNLNKCATSSILSFLITFYFIIIL